MAAAAVAFPMVMVVMVAAEIGIPIQLAGQEGSHSVVRIAGYTAEQLNSGCCQCHLSAAADSTADQNIRMLDMLKAGYGDIVGKYSCLNDWKLSALIRDEYFRFLEAFQSSFFLLYLVLLGYRPPH